MKYIQSVARFLYVINNMFELESSFAKLGDSESLMSYKHEGNKGSTVGQNVLM